DDDELVVSIEIQERVDLGRPVQERFVEIFSDTDVVGINSPGSHTPFPCRSYGMIRPNGPCVNGHGSEARSDPRSGSPSGPLRVRPNRELVRAMPSQTVSGVGFCRVMRADGRASMIPGDAGQVEREPITRGGSCGTSRWTRSGSFFAARPISSTPCW